MRGACRAEWTAAAGCPAGNTDPRCVLDVFNDLALPAGFANLLVQCTNAGCGGACSAP